jgi:hypothetical protein
MLCVIKFALDTKEFCLKIQQNFDRTILGNWKYSLTLIRLVIRKQGTMWQVSLIVCKCTCLLAFKAAMRNDIIQLWRWICCNTWSCQGDQTHLLHSFLPLELRFHFQLWWKLIILVPCLWFKIPRKGYDASMAIPGIAMSQRM